MASVSENDFFVTDPKIFARLRDESPEKEEAWRDFARKYIPMITGFARKLSLRPEDIDELVQSVLIGFFGRVPKFVYNPAQGRFRGYLKTCTLHAYQKLKKSRPLLLDHSFADTADNSPGVEAAWESSCELHIFYQAVEVVRQQYRSRPETARTFQAFEMGALLLRAPEEIAKELGMEINSVYQAKRRVSKAIKAAMKRLDDSID